jgi:glycosyltransferase involved in cell wall biosynthesis
MKIYPLLRLKRRMEEWIMAPAVWWGRRWAARHPLETEYDIFFFFPIYGLGGAEKVNADIIHCTADKKAIIFFTRTSYDATSLHLFQKPHVTIKDISRWTDNKWRYWDNLFYRGVCAHYINSQRKKPVVFNGQNNFAYKLFPHLDKEVRKIELIHNSAKHFAWITFPYIPFIDQRIMITDVHLRDHARYYDEIGIPAAYRQRMRKILNRIDVPEGAGPKKAYGSLLKIYYAGRGGPQKRIHLLLEAMERCAGMGLPVSFHMVGNFRNELPAGYERFVTYHGELQGGAAMHAFHREMDVLVMTSAFEGFPIVIMEAMINGVVPVATSVDGVPEHIRDGENGLLIKDAADENGVVNQLVQHIVYLSANREHLLQMSGNAFTYARDHFSGEQFCRSYREVLQI